MDLDIDKVAELARLNLKPEEKQKLAKELEAILGYVKALDQVDTSHVIPTSHVLDLENVFREDEVREVTVRDKALQYAPDRDGKFFKVPKVVDK